MGLRGSKAVQKDKKNRKNVLEIPPDSPLGMKLTSWDKDPRTKGKDKAKMIQFCMFSWAKEEIRYDQVYWLRYGSSKRWICHALNAHVNTKAPPDPEECEYASCWLDRDETPKTKVYRISEVGEKGSAGEKKDKPWDPWGALPPLYIPAQVTPGISRPPTPVIPATSSAPSGEEPAGD